MTDESETMQTSDYADTDEHRWLVARVALGEATADQMLDRMRWAQHPYETRCEIDYLRAELKHWRRLYGRQSATIGGLRDTVGRLRSERDAWRESSEEGFDHCGDPAPSIFAHPAASWCVRRPGHSVPHRDANGAEWVRDYRQLTEQEGGPPNERGGEPTCMDDDPGASDSTVEVWIPPRTDCMERRPDKPCPHCGGLMFHHRTRRCGDCGRRP